MVCKKETALRLVAAIGAGVVGAGCGVPPEATDAALDEGSSPVAAPADTGADETVIPDYCVPVVLKAGQKKKDKGGSGAGAPPATLGAPVLAPGQGPDTADACVPGSAALPGSPDPAVPGVERSCFVGDDPSSVQATIERTLEQVDGADYLHVRLTFNPHFVDNSYGTTAVGWEESKKGGHTFKDLVGSDHAELLFADGSGDVAMHLKMDYLSEDPSQPSGYGTLGVSGGGNDGEVFVGDEAHVLEVATSLDRNLNGCGYGGYTDDSPATDAAYTPNPAAPDWDFRVVFELWIDAAAFGSAGPGDVYVEYVHASPSKTGSNTVTVTPGDCPPDTPYDPNAPETPENPEEPETPDEPPFNWPPDWPPYDWPPFDWPSPPEEPEEPESPPETPAEPEEPDNPDPPEVPEGPEPPDAPRPPYTPGSPEFPEEPEPPEPPASDGPPYTPGSPEFPEEPDPNDSDGPPYTPDSPEFPEEPEQPPCPPGTVHVDDPRNTEPDDPNII